MAAVRSRLAGDIARAASGDERQDLRRESRNLRKFVGFPAIARPDVVRPDDLSTVAQQTLFWTVEETIVQRL
jgi:hypothetical protein